LPRVPSAVYSYPRFDRSNATEFLTSTGLANMLDAKENNPHPNSSFILLMIDGRNERGGGRQSRCEIFVKKRIMMKETDEEVSNPWFKSTFESAKSIATRTTTIAQRIARQTYHRSKTRQKTLGWGIDIKFTKKCRRIPCGKTEKENRLQRRQNLFA